MPFGNEFNHTLDGLTVRGGFGLANSSGGNATVDYDRFAAMARYAVCIRAQGYMVESFPRAAIAGTTATATGVLYCEAVGFLAGDTITNVIVECGTVGTGLTLAKVGVYSKTGTLLASSASQHADWNAATGIKTVAMTTPYVVPTDDAYFLAIIGVTGTGASLARSATNNGPFNGAIGSGTIGVSAIQTGQTDLPASATLTYNTGTSIVFWTAAS